MPTNRSEYEIQIKSTADTAGIKEGKDGLKGLGQAAEELGESAKKGGEGVEEMVGGHHGIHAIGHALNEAVPGLLQFTRFLTSGFTAAVGGALVAFEFLKGKIEDFNKALDELNTGPGARGEWAEQIAENTRTAAVETAVFTERLRELQERQDGLAQSTDRLIAAQHSQASDAQSVANAQKELELARLTLAEKLGQVTPEQAVMIRLQIDDAAFKHELEAKKAEIKAELSAREQEFNANENREPQLRAAKEHADAAALAAANAETKNKSKLDQDKENLKAAEEAQKKNDEWLLSHSGPMSEYGPDRLEKHTRERAGESLQRQIGGLSTSIKQEEEKQTALAASAAVAKEQAAAAKADYEEAAKLSHDVLEIVNKLKADLAAATARNDALENIHHQTSQVQAASAHADTVNRVRAGHGTAAENTAVADDNIRSQAANETGGLEGVDAAAAIAQARIAAANMAGISRGGASPDQLQQLHALLNQKVGFQENHSAAVQMQHGGLEETVQVLTQRLNALETRTDMNRTSP